jgi:hypothetical protein
VDDEFHQEIALVDGEGRAMLLSEATHRQRTAGTDSFTREEPMVDETTAQKRSEAARKAALTKKRRAAGKKAALTRKRREAGKKAALTRKRRAAGKKAALTRKTKKQAIGAELSI